MISYVVQYNGTKYMRQQTVVDLYSAVLLCLYASGCVRFGVLLCPLSASECILYYDAHYFPTSIDRLSVLPLAAALHSVRLHDTAAFDKN